MYRELGTGDLDFENQRVHNALFLEKTAAAEHGRRLLEEMTAQNAVRAAADGIRRKGNVGFD